MCPLTDCRLGLTSIKIVHKILLQSRAALTGRLLPDHRRPAMVSFRAGGADFVGIWVSKPKWWPELERPEMAPARVKTHSPIIVHRRLWLDFSPSTA